MVAQIITLATGQVRQWSCTDTLQADPVRDLTWVTPRTLAFYVPLNAPDAPTTTAPPQQDSPGTWLLDTAAPGHNTRGSPFGECVDACIGARRQLFGPIPPAPG
jgi:hypothetical protein